MDILLVFPENQKGFFREQSHSSHQGEFCFMLKVQIYKLVAGCHSHKLAKGCASGLPKRSALRFSRFIKAERQCKRKQAAFPPDARSG